MVEKEKKIKTANYVKASDIKWLNYVPPTSRKGWIMKVIMKLNDLATIGAALIKFGTDDIIMTSQAIFENQLPVKIE